MSSWGYTEKDGPLEWHKDFPVAKEGKRQSPIDIETESVKEAWSVTTENPLVWEYTEKHCLNVENTGASWKVNVDGTGSTLKGGPLDKAEYELWQFHAHWGNDSSHGSEHTIDGKDYAAELHLVHWNRTAYPSPNVAAGHGDGLAVLGLFMEVGEEDHPELAKLIPHLEQVQYSGEKVTICESGINPANFLPKGGENKRFWNYLGSLTTPPLLESVIWIVFQKPIKVSEKQLEIMRSLFFTPKEAKEPCQMCNNYRPPVKLGSRDVKEM